MAGIRSKEEGKLNIKFTLTKWVNIKMFKSQASNTSGFESRRPSAQWGTRSRVNIDRLESCKTALKAFEEGSHQKVPKQHFGFTDM